MLPLSSIWSDTLAVFTNSGYSLFKIEAHVVCAAVLIILFCRQQNSSDQTEARLAWSNLLLVQILYCISGIIRVFVDVGIIPRTYISQWLVTSVTFWLFGAMCWLVFVYIELYQKSNLMASTAKRITISLPFCFNTIMIAISAFFPGMFVDFSGREMIRGTLYPFAMLLNFAYPVAAVVLSVRRRSKMTRYERDTVPMMAIFPAFFMVCGPLQDIEWRVPFLCYVIVVSDIFVYISYADSLVSVDPLTKIPNRNELMRVLAERMKQGGLESLHIFTADIDMLDEINSRYGRQEGDRVLVTVAEALKKFQAEEHSCQVSRYYGDEFILTADIEDSDERDLFAEHIRNYISNAAMSGNLPCRVHINIGWAKYEPYSRTETISGLIEEAEKMMRDEKELRRISGQKRQ